MTSRTLGQLKSVDIRSIWQDEAQDFTPWLAREEILEQLSEKLGMDLELEGINVPVGPYYADIVSRDAASNEKVVIENQLEKTNHDHLGKVLTYASGLNAKIIIWIAREFTEEHRRALDFLNDAASPDMRLYGLEITLLSIGDSQPAPQFTVIASPNEYTQSVRIDQGDLTHTKATYLEFWKSLKEYMTTNNTSLNLRKARPQHWYSIAIGRSKFSLTLTISTIKKRIGCEIYIRGANADSAFKLLKAQKEDIEAELGSLEWMELPQGQDCRIVQFKNDVDILNKNTWESCFDWLKNNAENYHQVFSPRIRNLVYPVPAEEDETEDEKVEEKDSGYSGPEDH